MPAEVVRVLLPAGFILSERMMQLKPGTNNPSSPPSLLTAAWNLVCAGLLGVLAYLHLRPQWWQQPPQWLIGCLWTVRMVATAAIFLWQMMRGQPAAPPQQVGGNSACGQGESTASQQQQQQQQPQTQTQQTHWKEVRTALLLIAVYLLMLAWQAHTPSAVRGAAVGGAFVELALPSP